MKIRTYVLSLTLKNVSKNVKKIDPYVASMDSSSDEPVAQLLVQ